MGLVLRSRYGAESSKRPSDPSAPRPGYCAPHDVPVALPLAEQFEKTLPTAGPRPAGRSRNSVSAP
jgi:hypothetical protein